MVQYREIGRVENAVAQAGERGDGDQRGVTGREMQHDAGQRETDDPGSQHADGAEAVDEKAGRRLTDAGVTWIVSSDAGIGPHKPPGVLPYAVPQAVAVTGQPVAHALAACTSRAADALGIADRAGRLRPGMPADLLAVDGRVDDDPAAVTRPLFVIRRGEVVVDCPTPSA